MQSQEAGSSLELLDDIEKYMFTNSFINKYNSDDIRIPNPMPKLRATQTRQELITPNLSSEPEQRPVVSNKSAEKERNFSPHEKDKLFWCFYILINGFDSYQLNRGAAFKTEKDFKIEAVERLDSVKSKLKEKSIKLNDVKDELANSPCISVKGLYALCFLYEINVVYVANKTFYDISGSSDGTSPYQIIVNDKKTVFISNNSDETTLTHYRTNFLEIENINKPLLGIGSYTLQQLKDISNKLGLTFETKKPTKKEIYERLVHIILN